MASPPKGPQRYDYMSQTEKKNYISLFKKHERYINSIISNIKITENKIDSQNKKLINLFNEENKIIIILKNLNKDFSKYENLSMIPKYLINEKKKLNKELLNINKKKESINNYLSILIKSKDLLYYKLDTETPVLNFLESELFKEGGKKKYKK